jgi:bifunctional DNA-binding transcriptional regulator/antitoxin component of YhaV-PrlF toxin-antitoxin module
LPSGEKVEKEGQEILRTLAGYRRITSKGQVTIPNVMRKRYNITTDVKLEFIPQPEGILLRPTRDIGTFRELAGSASKHWTVDEMLRRLDELREENV